MNVSFRKRINELVDEVEKRMNSSDGYFSLFSEVRINERGKHDENSGKTENGVVGFHHSSKECVPPLQTKNV